MNHAHGVGSFGGDGRVARGAMDGVGRGLPGEESSRSAAETIAENPAKLRLAGKLISWATTGNAVRFEKVAALRQAIEAETYSVSSADLAEKLMDGMRG